MDHEHLIGVISCWGQWRAVVCLLLALPIQMFSGAGNGWPHNVIRGIILVHVNHNQLPISKFRDCNSVSGHESDIIMHQYRLRALNSNYTVSPKTRYLTLFRSFSQKIWRN